MKHNQPIDQWEQAWNNYISKLNRLEELKQKGRYGYQLRMSKLALCKAIENLRRIDPGFCKRLGI